VLLACARTRAQNIVTTMFRPLAHALVVSIVASLAAACTQVNPFFVPISGGDDASTDGSAGLSSTSDPELTTVDPDSGLEGEGASTRPTTGDVPEPATTTDASTTTGVDPIDTSTGEPGTSTSTGDPIPDTSTGQTDTGQPPPEAVTVIASLATCILLPGNGLGYLGPVGCEFLAEQDDGLGQTGVMIVDQFFTNGGNGRQAQLLLRFQIPAELAGKVLLGAVLDLQVSTSVPAASTWSGVLRKVTNFDTNTLLLGPPLLLYQLTGDPGPAVPGQASSWQVPLPEIVPGTTLHLNLAPLDTDGVLYRSTRASDDKKPTLTITYQ